MNDFTEANGSPRRSKTEELLRDQIYIVEWHLGHRILCAEHHTRGTVEGNARSRRGLDRVEVASQSKYYSVWASKEESKDLWTVVSGPCDPCA